MLIVVVILVALATYFLLQGITAGQKQVAMSLRRAKTYGGYSLREAELGKSMSDRVVGPAATRLASLALRATPRGSVEGTRRKLIAAGKTNANPTTYLAGKAVVSCLFLLFGFVLLVTGTPVQTVVILILGGLGASFVLPDYYLSMRTKSRKEDLVAQMPDVLDLLTVSVEAGLGFDAAIVKVCERMKGPLVEEFRIVLHEMRIGEARVEGPQEHGRPARHERDDDLRALDRAGRPARHLARPDPARAGPGHAPPPSDGGGGAGHEGADQDAVPDRGVHLPGHVRRDPRPGDDLADEAVHRLSARSSSTRVSSSLRSSS